MIKVFCGAVGFIIGVVFGLAIIANSQSHKVLTTYDLLSKRQECERNGLILYWSTRDYAPTGISGAWCAPKANQ